MGSTKESIKYQRQSSLASVSVSVGVGRENEETHSEMGQSQRWDERKDHPLFNHVILNIIFEFMGGKDLKECRLVCQKWCVSTLPSARSKFSVTLHGNEAEMTRKLTDFVEIFRQNTLGIPFVKYNLDPFCTTEEPGQEFLRISGSTAKTVSLGPLVPKVLRMEVEDISALLKAMSNIQSFHMANQIHSRSGNAVKLFPDSSAKPTLSFLKELDVFNRDTDNMSDCCPTFMEEILSVAPNISDFRVADSRNDPDKSTIGQVLKAIEKFERASVIANLNLINGKIEHFESLRRLTEIGLKLKNLGFIQCIQEQEGENKCLPQLAKLFKSSIERLSVDEVCSSFIQLPYMPKLERLKFHISKDFESKCVNLNKLFPVLKELKLIYREYDEEDDEDDWDEFLPNSEPCPNLKSLTLRQFVFKSRNLEVFDHILHIFPKLIKLEMYVETDGEEILRKIMTQMTQLEDLSLNGTVEGIESIDALLTGIPVPKIRKLEHLVSELKKMNAPLRTENIRHYSDRYCRFPSITNLTKLKRLHLSTIGSGSGPTGETRMTDVFAYFGLYSMKHINKLQIGDCEFTKSGCEILAVGMELESWTFQDKDDRDIIPQVK